MRVTLALFLALGIATVVRCEVGDEDDPLPEDHDYGDEEDEEGENAGEEGGDEGGSEKLGFHEDDGKHEQLTQKHLRDLHKKFDTNKDGKASLDEIMTFAHESNKKAKAKEIQSIFHEIDATKDGHLSLEEHLAEYEEILDTETNVTSEREVLKQHETEKFRAADTDGDDKLDKDELVAFMSPETHPEVFDIHTKHIFKTQDLNGDGKISKDEWDKTVRREHEAHMDENLDHEGEFKELDEDGSGDINFEEMRHWESGRFHLHQSMKKVFHVGDKDNDKHMTEHELAMIVDHIEEHADAHSHLTYWAMHDHDEM